MGSPPPAGSKNLVLKFRSVSNMVIAPASTGSARRRSTAVSRTDQAKRGIISKDMPSPRILAMVVIKLALPRMLLTPARCSEKIPKSTAPPGCPRVDRGGYTVQPVPAPLSTSPDIIRSESAGGRSQNLILFIRGKAISGAWTNRGTNQFPKPPIMVGITKKKIMINA